MVRWIQAVAGCAWTLGGAAHAADASWVEVGGSARVSFVAFGPGADPSLPPGAACSAMLTVGPDGAAVAPVPWDADRRVSRHCEPAVLEAAQAASAEWSLALQAWTPDATAQLPVSFVAGEGGRLTASVRAERYGVSAAHHPAGLELVEEARLLRAPKARFPRSARALVKAGELPATATCRMTLALTAEGRVASVAVTECPEPLRAAVEALGAAYRFSPRLVNGAPTATELPVAVQLTAE